MRLTLRIIINVLVIALVLGLAYLIYTNKFLLYPVIVLAVLWFVKMIYSNRLRRKRNKIDFTTESGRVKIKELNRKIDRLNGDFNKPTN